MAFGHRAAERLDDVGLAPDLRQLGGSEPAVEGDEWLAGAPRTALRPPVRRHHGEPNGLVCRLFGCVGGVAGQLPIGPTWSISYCCTSTPRIGISRRAEGAERIPSRWAASEALSSQRS